MGVPRTRFQRPKGTRPSGGRDHAAAVPGPRHAAAGPVGVWAYFTDPPPPPKGAPMTVAIADPPT